MVVHASSPRTQEAEAGGLVGVQGHPGFQHLGARTVLPEDPGLLLSSDMVAQTCNSLLRGSGALLWPHMVCTVMLAKHFFLKKKKDQFIYT